MLGPSHVGLLVCAMLRGLRSQAALLSHHAMPCHAAAFACHLMPCCTVPAMCMPPASHAMSCHGVMSLHACLLLRHRALGHAAACLLLCLALRAMPTHGHPWPLCHYMPPLHASSYRPGIPRCGWLVNCSTHTPSSPCPSVAHATSTFPPAMHEPGTCLCQPTLLWPRHALSLCRWQWRPWAAARSSTLSASRYNTICAKRLLGGKQAALANGCLHHEATPGGRQLQGNMHA